MSRFPRVVLSVALAAAIGGSAVVVAPASAEVKNPRAEQAFRKGIRDEARLHARGTKASKIRISCKEVPKVDDSGACTGSFDLTRSGRTAHYVLTKKARTTRLSPGAIEYLVASKAVKAVKGLPRKTALAGFLQ